MRGFLRMTSIASATAWVVLACAGIGAEEVPPPALLLNVSLLDSQGVTTQLAGFHCLSGEERFQGFVGSAEVEVPYARLRGMRIAPPAQPGGRMRAALDLLTGGTVDATFDQREAEVLFRGLAYFGEVRVYMRDIREVAFLGRTTPEDLPSFGPRVRGVNALLRDREEVRCELVRFRRLAGENIIPGIRGATAIAVPMGMLRDLVLADARQPSALAAKARLRGGRSVEFLVPGYELGSVYGGDLEYGVLRIRLGDIQSLEVHRPTPTPADEADKGDERGEGVDGKGSGDPDDFLPPLEDATDVPSAEAEGKR